MVPGEHTAPLQEDHPRELTLVWLHAVSVRLRLVDNYRFPQQVSSSCGTEGPRGPRGPVGACVCTLLLCSAMVW